MRHGNAGRRLGRKPAQRKAMMRSLATQLFTHGRIRTTETRAKELRPVADKMITLAKRGDLHARRQVLETLFDKKVVSRLFSEVAGWYEKRQGGYTRILKLDNRPGDNAPMAFIELVDRKELGIIKTVVPPKKKFKKKGEKKAETKAKPEGAEKPAAEKKAAKKKATPKKKKKKD